ncbi:MAG: hypothetical protein R6X25_03075 [Candidatus Krumholzibacteriia bacterium]
MRWLWILVGVAIFVALYLAGAAIGRLWFSFPLFCLGLLGMAWAGERVKTSA